MKLKPFSIIFGFIVTAIGVLSCFLVFNSWVIEEDLLEVSGVMESYSHLTVQGDIDKEKGSLVKITLYGDERVFSFDNAILAKMDYDAFKKNVKNDIKVTLLASSKKEDNGVTSIYAFTMDDKEYLSFSQSKEIFRGKQIGGTLGSSVFILFGIFIFLLPLILKAKVKLSLRKEQKEISELGLDKFDEFTEEIKAHFKINNEFIEALKKYVQEIEVRFYYGDIIIDFSDEKVPLYSLIFTCGVAVIEYYLDENSIQIPLSYDREVVDLGLVTDFTNYRVKGKEKLFEDILFIIESLLITKCYIEHEDKGGEENTEEKMLETCQIVTSNSDVLAYTKTWADRNIARNFAKYWIKTECNPNSN